jgi:hypothetical protein
MKTFAYDGSSDALREVYELRDSDIVIVCGTCGAELIVALDHETANRYQVHTGIFCPNKHICELIEIRAEPAATEGDAGNRKAVS